MNPFFDNFYNYEGFGPAIKATPPDSATLDKYKNKLPDRLLEYWQEYGFCGWGQGLLWTVNPDDYADILATWLQGSPFETKDKYHVIARSAFGKLRVWGENSGSSMMINSLFGMLFPTDNTAKYEERGGDKSIDLFFGSSSKSSYEQTDEDEKPLFERALNTLGELEADEMYGLKLAPALGGLVTLENLQKVKAIEYSAFLADLGEKQIMADVVAMSNALHAKD